MNIKAEAIYQLKEARESGVKQTYMSNKTLYVFYKNGTNVINDGFALTVQFELNGNIYSIDVR